jgi:3-hydroxyisobutyrate dehydrogenase-like beta-hydroxyacid dehydrogenase
MATPQLKVTFLGLGGMGSAIAKSIQKKGFELVVWSRTASKADVWK